MEIFNKIRISNYICFNTFTDCKNCSFDLCLWSSLNFCDSKMFSCKASYNLSFFCYFFSCRSCRSCCWSCCRSYFYYLSASAKCTNRNRKINIFSFTNVDFKNSACNCCCCWSCCYRSCCWSRYCWSRFLCCFLCFFLYRIFCSLNNICCQR